MSGQEVAGVRLPGEDQVAFADLPVLESSEHALEDANVLVAAILELRERLTAGQLGSDARYDLALDLYELTSKLQGFALGVLA